MTVVSSSAATEPATEPAAAAEPATEPAAAATAEPATEPAAAAATEPAALAPASASTPAPLRVIISFDNTMGVPGCDLDDALALLYLLGCPEQVRLEALCTAYGNSDIDTVHANTLRMCANWGLDLPVYRGAASADEPVSEAARFLARATAEAPGEFIVLVTGSTTDLRGAALVDPGFYRNVRTFYLMGGIEHALVINGLVMDELNFSCDPAATVELLGSGAPVTIASAHNCMPAFFDRPLLEDAFGGESWLSRGCDYWFADMGERYFWDGFVCWDLVSAMQIVEPELFAPDSHDVVLDEHLMSVGLIERVTPATEGVRCGRIDTPVISDADALRASAIAAWKRAADTLGLK